MPFIYMFAIIFVVNWVLLVAAFALIKLLDLAAVDEWGTLMLRLVWVAGGAALLELPFALYIGILGLAIGVGFIIYLALKVLDVTEAGALVVLGLVLLGGRVVIGFTLVAALSG